MHPNRYGLRPVMHPHMGIHICDLDTEGPVADGPEESTVRAAFAGGWLHETVEPGTGPKWDYGDPNAWPLWEYADALLPHDLAQVTRDFDAPPYRVIQACAHRDVAMGWHRDITNPAGTVLNATTFFSRACTGGGLMFSEHDVTVWCEDLRLVVFDGSTLHGVEAFTLGEGGYRISLTFYLGAG